MVDVGWVTSNQLFWLEKHVATRNMKYSMLTARLALQSTSWSIFFYAESPISLHVLDQKIQIAVWVSEKLGFSPHPPAQPQPPLVGLDDCLGHWWTLDVCPALVLAWGFRKMRAWAKRKIRSTSFVWHCNVEVNTFLITTFSRGEMLISVRLCQFVSGHEWTTEWLKGILSGSVMSTTPTTEWGQPPWSHAHDTAR